MKKYFILLALSGILLSGCGNDQYAIEKHYYNALKQAEKIFKNPHSSPPNELESVVSLLSSFARKYPNSNLAIDAEFNIARLYIVKEEYERARSHLRSIINTFAKFKPVCAEALFLIGNSFEIENKWEQALAQYRKIMQEYPETLRGIETPVYIIQHYKVKFQPDKMMEASREAIAHYNALAGKYPGSPLAYRVYLLSAECYGVLKEWQNSINVYENIIQKYSGKVKVDGILMKIAVLYKGSLNNDAKAKETLEKLIRDYPKSSLINPAKNFLKKIEGSK